MLPSYVETFFSSAPGGAILPSRPARWCSRRAQRRSRTAASCGRPKGLSLGGCEHGGRLVCAGNDVDCLEPAFVLDRREIADRRVATSRVVEAFDKAEHSTARLGRCPEPASREQFAFQR